MYLFEDIWSRLIAEWEVHSYESGDVASEIIKKLERKRCLEGVHLHSDNVEIVMLIKWLAKNVINIILVMVEKPIF